MPRGMEPPKGFKPYHPWAYYTDTKMFGFFKIGHIGKLPRYYPRSWQLNKSLMCAIFFALWARGIFYTKQTDFSSSALLYKSREFRASLALRSPIDMMGLDEWWEERNECFQAKYKKEWFKGLRWQYGMEYAYWDPAVASAYQGILDIGYGIMPTPVQMGGERALWPVIKGQTLKPWNESRFMLPRFLRTDVPKITRDGTVTWGDASWYETVSQKPWRWGLVQRWGGSFWGPLLWDPPKFRTLSADNSDRWEPPQ
eukprot:TRINITY_DN47918_c0_g1_i1.p1 TRINITY_DN47918_c0_g1~~TRINITY_DN47918_c0_g1_i1.p1  ORF type:complete len:295 (-),score=2.55 TRINITY_DN47918_c0_g1_i1:146-910(-)